MAVGSERMKWPTFTYGILWSATSRRTCRKTDALDAERIARETLADPLLPRAFKRAGADSGPDAVMDQIALWHKARRPLLKSRQHILNEAESIFIALPEDLQERLGDTTDATTRLSRS